MYLEYLQTIIGNISKYHTYINNSWDGKINLKKKTIKNVYDNKQLEKLVLSYIDFLNQNALCSAIFDLQMQFMNYGIHIESRIKQNNSALYKIETYMNKKEKGQFPIYKCFNDLFGIRAIIDYDESLEHLLSQIIDLYPDLKCINASKEEYKAIHIYFISSNKTIFPWELQVWKKEDETNNRNSHFKYKQKYLNWEKEHSDKMRSLRNN